MRYKLIYIRYVLSMNSWVYLYLDNTIQAKFHCGMRETVYVQRFFDIENLSKKRYLHGNSK